MTYKTKEERAAYARAWRAANPEKVKAAEAKKRERRPVGYGNEKMRRWRAANPEKAQEQTRRSMETLYADPERLAHRREYERKYRDENADKRRAYEREWARQNRAKNPEYHRWMNILRKYGWTKAQYYEVLDAQDGHCAICPATPEQEHHGYLHVDHCHKTGKTAALLCGNCNTALGLLGEDPTRLQAAIDYIAKHRGS